MKEQHNTAQAADSVPAPVQSGLVATMLDALRHAQKVLNHNNLHMECGPVNAAILAACAPADSVLEDAARLDWLDQQREAYGFQDIHEGNRWEISGAYANVREAIDAARKQGANHD